jgi:molecular chaperone HtpG
MHEFDGKTFINIAKGDVDLGDLEDKEEKEANEKLQGEFKPLLDEFKTALGDKVQDVRISNRLTDSPACIVNDQNAMNPALIRMMKAAGQEVPTPKPILELNPKNALVARLREDGAFNADWAQLLLEQAQIAEGEQLADPAGFVQRMNAMLMSGLKDKKE